MQKFKEDLRVNRENKNNGWYIAIIICLLIALSAALNTAHQKQTEMERLKSKPSKWDIYYSIAVYDAEHNYFIITENGYCFRISGDYENGKMYTLEMSDNATPTTISDDKVIRVFDRKDNGNEDIERYKICRSN